jgi:HAE1 family hydrophobic/amphiphilic exporter-1
MRLTEFSLKNALVIVTIFTAIALWGVSAYRSLGVSVIPTLHFPTVIITTTYAGAAPETVETQVTKPIEDAIAGLSNIDRMTSTSSEGISQIVVEFTTEANMDLVPVDVQRAVNSVRSQMPADSDVPTVTRIDSDSFTVLWLAMSGPYAPGELKKMVDDVLEKPVKAVPGVSAIRILGAPDREIRVKVDQTKLQARGLYLSQVPQALQREHLELPSGSLDGGNTNVNVRLNGLVTNPQQLGEIIVASSPVTGAPTYLKDVATIEDGYKKASVISRVNGTPGIAITITKLGSANTIAVSAGVRKVLDQYAPLLPPGVQMTKIQDAADYAQQSFDTIQRSLLEAVVMTGLILLLFLHTWRSTFIVVLAIPTSLLATLGMMQVMNFNLNLLSMLALTLTVGILVDDSIVVLENIFRHLHLGERPLTAALKGRSEIGLAAITITLVDVAVFVPIALISGLAGQFFRQFALVVACATLFSLLVSFTLTPLMASRWLNRAETDEARQGWLATFGRRWDAAYDQLAVRYGHLLGWALRRRWWVIALGVASMFIGMALPALGLIGSDFFPTGDQSEIDVTVEMPESTSLAVTDEAMKTIEERLSAMHEVKTVYSNVGYAPTGFSGGSSGDKGIIMALMVPPHERDRSAVAIADSLRTTVADGLPDAKVRIGVPNAFGFGGFGDQPIQVQVQGPNPLVLDELAAQVFQIVQNVKGASEVKTSNNPAQTQEVITVDRDRAADLGLSAQQAAVALRTAVNGTVATKFQQPGEAAVDIRVVAEGAENVRLERLAGLPLTTARGKTVTLGQIATLRSDTIATKITHNNRERVITIGATPSGRLLGDVQGDVQTALKKLYLPTGYSISYAGQGAQSGDAFTDVYKAMGTAFLLIFTLMVLLFGSIMLPLAVMMSLPLAVVGALGGLALTQTSFNIFSLLGFAMLMGLVGKNAILLVDFTNTLRKQGVPRDAALLEAGPTRLRPILMTTISIVAALLPVALRIGEGSELLTATGVVLIGGLITSTLLTLVFVPAMYTVFDDVQGLVIRLVTWRPRQRTVVPDAPPALPVHEEVETLPMPVITKEASTAEPELSGSHAG